MQSFNITGHQCDYTIISNNFIDLYMLESNGEFVKVYLLLLRLLSAKNNNLSLALIADQLNLTESDVLRALKYWHLKNIITLHTNNNSITDITINRIESDQPEAEPELSSANETKVELSSTIEATDDFGSQNKPKYSNTQLLAFKSKDDYAELIMVAEKFLGELSQPDLSTLISFHEWLKLPTDVIISLIEFAVSNNNKKMRYIEKVAIDWAKRGINTLNKVKQQTEHYNKFYYNIKKALGLSSINPVDYEIKIMDKWLNTYSFDIDIILEACNRTMQHAPTGGFKYTDSILTKWHKNNIKSPQDIRNMDEAYRSKEKVTTIKKATNPTPKKNKFTDYDQRVYDFDQWEQNMLKARLKETSKGNYN